MVMRTLPVPKLSVVMATYNRADTLRITLDHLADQTLDPDSYEVIVIDDGSPDNTRAVAAEWLAKAPFRMRYIHHANQGPGYTQNRGLEVAEAPIVLLMADDIFMTREALAAHLRMHEQHPEAHVAVLGNVVQSKDLNQSVFLRTWDSFRFTAIAGRRELPYYKFWACNVSGKRDFIMKYGPFREARGRGGAAAHEDPQLGYRLHLGGMQLLHCPDALGYHYHIVTLEGACRRRYMQGINFGEFHQHAPMPEIPVAYHVLNWSTLGDHFLALSGSRRRHLEPADRNVASLILRHAALLGLFNGLTVRVLWQPLLNRAERHRSLAAMVRPFMYRGLLFHHFLRGVRDGNRKYGNASRLAQVTAPSEAA